MSDTEPPVSGVGTALVSPRRATALIWLLPVAAALLGVWLIWRSLADASIAVTLSFDDGAGITPGQTPVRYAGITVGHVSDMSLQEDLTGVEVTLAINRSAEPLLREQTRFWLVRPQVSLAGITGLETLVSGNYIALRPGEGPPRTRFQALTEEPRPDASGPGLHLVLTADSLGSLTVGAPVFYKQVEVGSVQNHALRRDGSGVDIHVLVEPEYRDLVNRSSRFWNASGVNIRGGLRGFEVQTGSLLSLLRGGILFHTPDEGAEPVLSGTEFELFRDHRQAAAGLQVELKVPEPDGIQAGRTEIRYRGYRLGRIDRLTLDPEDPTRGAVATARLSPEAESYLLDDAHFWVVRPRLSLEGVSGLDALLGGPYIELSPGREGQPRRSFVLAQQPPPEGTEGGLLLRLKSPSLGSLNRGSPVYYRQFQVGRVQDVLLEREGSGVEVRVLSDEEHAHLVSSRSRFWNASGVDVSGGLDGIQLRTESLMALLAGGIAFSTAEGGEAVANQHRFSLHSSRSEAEQQGVLVDLYLPSARGLKVGSPLRYQGIDVGAITELELAPDSGGVVARLRIDREPDRIARQDSRFWVVQPRLGLLETRNLDTLVGGAYLAVDPGRGPAGRRFTALADAPVDAGTEGMPVILEAPRLGTIRRGLKVYYRDVPVGVVAGHRLANPADRVEIELRIDPEHAHLVRRDSRFFSVSGVQVDAGLFRGVRVDVGSVEALFSGGIGFASPSGDTPPAEPGARFPLAPRAEPGWLEWEPGLSPDEQR